MEPPEEDWVLAAEVNEVQEVEVAQEDFGAQIIETENF